MCIYWLVFTMEADWVLCDVRTEAQETNDHLNMSPFKMYIQAYYVLLLKDSYKKFIWCSWHKWNMWGTARGLNKQFFFI